MIFLANRIMPHNLEAEMSVLGVAFLNDISMERIIENINEDMFFSDANKKIFNHFIKVIHQ